VQALTDYLIAHESDIADDINDFGTLKSTFKWIVKREVNQ